MWEQATQVAASAVAWIDDTCVCLKPSIEVPTFAILDAFAIYYMHLPSMKRSRAGPCAFYSTQILSLSIYLLGGVVVLPIYCRFELVPVRTAWKPRHIQRMASHIPLPEVHPDLLLGCHGCSRPMTLWILTSAGANSIMILTTE